MPDHAPESSKPFDINEVIAKLINDHIDRILDVIKLLGQKVTEGARYNLTNVTNNISPRPTSATDR